jgi:prepilin-type N-terminal cleavage/methylation domain-containing protein
MFKKVFLQHTSKQLGFTLVELLVVIAIIGILSSVAVVNLNSARQKAKIAAVKHSLASLGPAIQLCYADNKELTAEYLGPLSCTSGICYCNDNYPPEALHPICEGSLNTWPNIGKYGFAYLECDPSVYTDNTWTINVVSSWGLVIMCDQAGCA